MAVFLKLIKIILRVNNSQYTFYAYGKRPGHVAGPIFVVRCLTTPPRLAAIRIGDIVIYPASRICRLAGILDRKVTQCIRFNLDCTEVEPLPVWFPMVRRIKSDVEARSLFLPVYF